MDLEKLKRLIEQGESETLEFKKSTAQLFSAFETVCAFMNGKGGTVLIGVTDNKRIMGQQVSDSTNRAIANEINKIEPPAPVDVKYISIDKERQVIVIQVQLGIHVPYIYNGRAFQRNQSTTVQMLQHRYEQLLVERSQLNHSWEEFPISNYDIQALDHEEIQRTIQQGITKNRIPAEALNENIEEALARLQLIKNGNLINAAMVLFAKNVLPDYPQCVMKMARFRGSDKLADFMDSQRIEGNAFKLLSEANNFTMRHLPVASFFNTDQFERVDKPTLPVLAIREAIINAIIHKDYTHRSSSISLAIFDDRLEIWNSGSLTSQLKIQDLKKRHESYPRNELIATVFYKRGWVEAWGTGTLRMSILCRQEGIPDPEFEEYSGGFSVTFRFKEPISATRKIVATQPLTSMRQQAILQILRLNNHLSAYEIFSQLQTSASLRTIKADLSVLLKLKFIEQQGKGKNTRWKIKP